MGQPEGLAMSVCARYLGGGCIGGLRLPLCQVPARGLIHLGPGRLLT
jgi:hypothetical protein